MKRDVFQAIADPTRREILNMLTKKQMNVNAVAHYFKISRPAVSKHLKILTECGLVLIVPEGRDRFCVANFDQLKEVNEWTAKFSKFWNHKLDALGDFLDSQPDK